MKSYCIIHEINRNKDREIYKRNALNYRLEFPEDQLQFNSLPIQFYSTLCLSIQFSRNGSIDNFSILAKLWTNKEIRNEKQTNRQITTIQ